MMNGNPNFKSKFRKTEFPIPWKKHRIKTDSLRILPRLRTHYHILRLGYEDIEAEIIHLFRAVDFSVQQLHVQKVLIVLKYGTRR
ncbi:hypothetical protein L1987_79926 [Smallanthus sonchifolius]|uniref:Uncharacterized protein n=1 Tax=Smallanthus sonchifolius TaxID=185202 RepID=A0ACB8YL73_9ASTR|nr:hypothetical protein L1987_79926 [Smallanthus sonchifolius]